MAEGNGGKIAIGCCSAAAVVVIAGIAGVFLFAPKIVDKVKAAFKSQEDVAVAMKIWDQSVQMADGDAGAVSPVAFAGFTRGQQMADAKPQGVDLGKTGHLSEYANGSTTVTVWSAEATSLESEAMLERIGTQNDERFSMKSSGSITTGNTTTFSYSGSPPKEGGLLVISGERVIFLQSNDADLDLKNLLQQFATEAAVTVSDALIEESDALIEENKEAEPSVPDGAPGLNAAPEPAQ
jgi:hypothetical protein